MFHLGNASEVNREKMTSRLQEAERERLVRQVLADGDKSTVLHSIGSRLSAVFTKSQPVCECKQDGKQVYLHG